MTMYPDDMLDLRVDRWARAHQVAARSEGWGLFYTSSRGYEIEKDDEVDRFESDLDAVCHVASQAQGGSAWHLEAFAIHCAHAWPGDRMYLDEDSDDNTVVP